MLRTLLFLLAVAGLQQSPPATAQLSGTVVDRSGGAIPGVTVTLEGSTPAASQKTETLQPNGAYKFDAVPPGTYTLRFELAGFVTYTRTRLVLAAGETQTKNVAVDIGPLVIVDRIHNAPPPPPDPRFDLSAGEVPVGIETTLGTFYIAVDAKRAPITSENFLKYVDAGLYNEGRFHRATRADNYTPSPPNRPMMNIIQGGINRTRYQGFPPIPLERTSVTGIKHITGVISMARGTAADTATSDFFVLLDDQPSLDFGGLRFDDGQGGAAFGRVLSGLDVVRKIQQQPVDGQNLAAPVTLKRAWRLGAK